MYPEPGSRLSGTAVTPSPACGGGLGRGFFGRAVTTRDLRAGLHGRLAAPKRTSQVTTKLNRSGPLPDPPPQAGEGEGRRGARVRCALRHIHRERLALVDDVHVRSLSGLLPTTL